MWTLYPISLVLQLKGFLLQLCEIPSKCLDLPLHGTAILTPCWPQLRWKAWNTCTDPVSMVGGVSASFSRSLFELRIDGEQLVLGVMPCYCLTGSGIASMEEENSQIQESLCDNKFAKFIMPQGFLFCGMEVCLPATTLAFPCRKCQKVGFFPTR